MANIDRGARVRGVVISWVLTILGILVITYVAGRLRAPDLPDEAPAFTARLLTGEVFELEALEGQSVVLNFWATWCGPCQFEIPAFSRFAARHPEIAVLGVVAPEPRARIVAAVRDLEIDYPVVLGTKEILDVYGVTTFPTTIFVGPDGRIQTAHGGLMLDPQLEFAGLGL